MVFIEGYGGVVIRKTGPEAQVPPNWVEVRTQDELERALARKGTIPICLGDGSFSVQGTAWVVASDLVTVAIRGGYIRAGRAATVLADGAVQVDTHDSATVVAKGNATVWARDRVNVTASGNSRVAAWGQGSELPTVHAVDSAAIEAKGAAVVDAFGDATVLAYGHPLVSANGRATVCAWSEAIVRAGENASIYAWGRARVDAYGAACVDAWQAASVRIYGSGEVRARGATTIELQRSASAKSTPSVTILRRDGQRQEVERLPSGTETPANPLEWCGFYGVDVVAEAVTLYKAVDDNFRSPCGTVYAPGSVPVQNGGEGHQLWAHPSLALEFAPQAVRFVACPVKISDLADYSRPSYPRKMTARRISAPVYEVALDGIPIQ